MLRTPPADHLKGARILVVEDSLMLAEVICEYLTHHELVPIGPAASIESACQLAREARLDAAILDIKLASRFSFPVCSILAERSIPYLFLTGFDELSIIPSAFREVPLLCKPFREDEIHAALGKMLANRAD
jgi:DNA-binding response OmpR family regulator